MTRWNKIYNYNVDCGCSTGCDSEPCGCKTKLSSLCIIYDNKDLENLGIEKGDNLENILKRTDLIIGDIITALEEQVVISNIGTGEEIYAGTDEDDVNLMKTVLGENGIELESTKEELIIRVDDDYVEGKLKPLKDEIEEQSEKIENLEEKVDTNSENIASNKKKGEDNSHEIDQLESRMDDVEEKAIENSSSISELKKETTNIFDDTQDLSKTVNQNSINIQRNRNEIKDLKDTVGGIERVYMHESIGQTIIELPHKSIDILRVNYCGAVLPNSGWVAQNGNQVAMQLSQYGLSVEASDVIQIEYKFKN